MVAKDAAMAVDDCSATDRSSKTCPSTNPQENRVSIDGNRDCLAKLEDVQNQLKELQLKVMADVESKLQEHAAYVRILLVEEVELQIMRASVKVGATNTSDTTAAFTRATLSAVGQAHENGCGELASLQGLGSPRRGQGLPNRRGLQEVASVSETYKQVPEPRAETRRRLNAIEQHLRSREKEALMYGIIGSVDQLAVAHRRRHVEDVEVLTIDQPCPWQQMQHLQSVHDGLDSSFLGPNETAADGCSEEARILSLSPPPPSNRPRAAVEHSSYTSSPGSSSPKHRQTCTQRHASPELDDILDRRRFISEGQIAQQAYGAFTYPRAKKNSSHCPPRACTDGSG